MSLNKFARCAPVALVLMVSSAWAEGLYENDWTRQFGTAVNDYGYSVAADAAGSAFIGGDTDGIMDLTNYGSTDAFLVKYHSSGVPLWKRQLGTDVCDHGRSVAVDTAGNAFLGGYTLGSLGGTSAGSGDAFLAKYNSSGTRLWTRQLGTDGNDYGYSVAVDAAGSVFISGYTDGSLGGDNQGDYDAFLAKYDALGTLSWTRQLGTSGYECCYSVAVDASGNAFIGGSTEGSLEGENQGNKDAFLAMYDTSGARLWTRQLGTSGYECCHSVAVDASGNAFISGYTAGSLGGDNQGYYDAFLAKYDTSGMLIWTKQLGTSANDYGRSVAVDAVSNAFLGGSTYGSLGGPNLGSYDAFLAKYSPVPEPGGLAMLAGIAMTGLLAYAWREQ